MRSLVVTALLLSACETGVKVDCDAALAKANPVLRQIRGGSHIYEDMREDCRAGKSDEHIRCVAAAQDQDAVAACFGAGAVR